MFAKSFIRGGQVVLHNIRMLRQVTGRLFLFGWFISSGLFFLLFTWWLTTSYQRSTTYEYWNAWLQTSLLNPHAVIAVSDEAGHLHWVIAHAVLTDPNVHFVLNQVKATVILTSILSILVGFLISGIILIVLLTQYGSKQIAKQTIRGHEIISNTELARTLKKSHKTSDLKLGTVPLLKGAEWGHFLFHGSTGAGKSTFMFNLLESSPCFWRAQYCVL